VIASADEPPRPEPRGASVRVVMWTPVSLKCSIARKISAAFGSAAELVDRLVAMAVLLIGEMDRDRVVAGLDDFRLRVERDGDVDGPRSGMEEVERPEVESASGEIGAHRRPDDDLFHDREPSLSDRRPAC
jgi:hypothetical protein